MLLQSTKSLWGASGLYGAMSVVQPPSLWWLRPMQVLQQVAASEGCPLSPDAAASIAALADGDVRNAIQTLQVMFAGRHAKQVCWVALIMEGLVALGL